jgi:Cof subfamily protein (haloacid dehalogenase superfamily)
LRADDAADCVPAWQQDAAMIHDCNGFGRGGQGLLNERSVDECSTAGGTPVGAGLGAEDRVAERADTFHPFSVEDAPGCGPQRSSEPALRHQTATLWCATGDGAARIRKAVSRYTGSMHPPVRLVAIDIDGTLLPTFSQTISSRNRNALKAAQEAGIVVAIATGRRTAYTAPLFEDVGLRANTPLITSNGAVTRTLGGDPLDRSHLEARVARGICALLRKFGALVFTFDRAGHGELVLEDPEQAHGRIALWVEANRDSIEVVKPLENALVDGEDPIQGMVAGALGPMKKAEKALKASEWASSCECARTEYPGRDLSILDLLPPGVSKGWALERLAARLGVARGETMAIGDNWNDVNMLEWAGQSVMMGNAAPDLRSMAKLRGWKQAPPNDEDGVAVVLEAILERQAEKITRPRHWTSMARS